MTPRAWSFGADGNLYVSSHGSGSVLRYRGARRAGPRHSAARGRPIRGNVRAAGSGSPGWSQRARLRAGRQSVRLQLGSPTSPSCDFDATTGDFLSTYVAPGAGGLNNPTRPGVRSGRPALRGRSRRPTPSIATTARATTWTTRSSAPPRLFQSPIGMIFDAQGALLVSSRDYNAVGRYDRGVAVTLSAASATPGERGTTRRPTAPPPPARTTRHSPAPLPSHRAKHRGWSCSRRLRRSRAGRQRDFQRATQQPHRWRPSRTGTATVTIVDPTWPQLSVADTSAIEGDTHGPLPRGVRPVPR